LSKTDLPKAWVSALFKKFQARYGHKWTTAIEGIEEIAVNEWAEGLSGVTGEQIKRGLSEWAEAWPPSMGEFKAACTGKAKNGFGLDYVPECYRERAPVLDASRLLSSDERDEKRRKGAEQLQALKQSLHGGK
jgi:hypothetical protein